MKTRDGVNISVCTTSIEEEYKTDEIFRSDEIRFHPILDLGCNLNEDMVMYVMRASVWVNTMWHAVFSILRKAEKRYDPEQ